MKKYKKIKGLGYTAYKPKKQINLGLNAKEEALAVKEITK